jgi:hypothetical protein
MRRTLWLGLLVCFAAGAEPRYRVGDVRFAGSPGIPEKELRRAAGLGGDYSEGAVEAALARLRSAYFSRGYFDARVSLGAVSLAGERADITIAAEAGPLYQVRNTSVGQMCRCLLEARRESEAEGKVDFAARLNLTLVGPTMVDLASAIQTGPAYTVGRIDFRGHHAFGDLTMRRALVLEEGELLDLGKLRRSLARIDRLGFFEPLGEDSVAAERGAAGSVRLTVTVKERPRGRWSLSGPAAPLPLAGPFQATVTSRIPAASTYFATLSLFGPTPRLWRLFSGRPLVPLVALDRPPIIGRRWQSGFRISPQAGWRETLAGYGATQLRALIQRDRVPEPPLPVAVASREGFLLCEAPGPRWRWLRAAASAMGWTL